MSVHATGPIATVAVTGDGTGVTSQAGTHLLGGIARQLGLAEGFSQVLAGTTTRSSAHDRGTVLTQVALTIAAGGRCLADLKALRDQRDLFGTVASDATAWRAVHQVDDVLLEELAGVRQAATRQLLQATGLDDRDEVVFDVDATLINRRQRSRARSGSHR